MRWKRSLLLVLALLGLFFLASAEYGAPASSKAIKGEILALLNDPLNLLDERSPGGRGPRVLLSIKGPHERVLSSVRERPPPTLPALDIPALAPPEAVASIPIAPPGSETLPPSQAVGSPSVPSYPNTIVGGAPTPSAPVPPAVPPGGPPTSNTPVPPAVPPGGPPTPPTIALPEPATWAIMILGLFAMGVGARRRVRQ